MIHVVRYLVITPPLTGYSSNTFTGTSLQQAATKWLSPPDPSVNYHNACDTHHEGTTTWFIESTAFKDWKQSGSLFWIHGKRMCPHSTHLGVTTDLGFNSGLWQERRYVCHP
jgi:hypothetical protein